MKRIMRAVLIGMVACLLVGLAPEPAAIAEAAAPTFDQAVGILQVYFQRINARNYRGAYSIYAAASLQRRQSYSAFATNFGLVSSFGMTVISTAPAGELTIVRVALVARLTIGGQVTYGGTYTIGRENGHFRIVSKNIVATGNSALMRNIPLPP